MPHGPGRVTSEPLKPRHKSKMRLELRMLKMQYGKSTWRGCPCNNSVHVHHMIAVRFTRGPRTTREKIQRSARHGIAAVAKRTLIVQQRYGYGFTDDGRWMTGLRHGPNSDRSRLARSLEGHLVVPPERATSSRPTRGPHDSPLVIGHVAARGCPSHSPGLPVTSRHLAASDPLQSNQANGCIMASPTASPPCGARWRRTV